MDMLVIFALGAALCAFPVLAERDVASATEGTVKKIDAITKTIVVKTANGTEHTVHFLDRTAVHGAELSSRPRSNPDSWSFPKRTLGVDHTESSSSVCDLLKLGEESLIQEYERIHVARDLICS